MQTKEMGKMLHNNPSILAIQSGDVKSFQNCLINKGLLLPENKFNSVGDFIRYIKSFDLHLLLGLQKPVSYNFIISRQSLNIKK